LFFGGNKLYPRKLFPFDCSLNLHLQLVFKNSSIKSASPRKSRDYEKQHFPQSIQSLETGESNNNQPEKLLKPDAGYDIIDSYKKNSQALLKDGNTASKMRNLRNYLDSSIQIFIQFKNLHPKQKDQVRKNLQRVLDNDNDILTSYIKELNDSIKKNAGNFNALFKFLSFCFSQTLHSRKQYEGLVKHLLNSEIIFQFDETKRFSLILLFVCHYEEASLVETLLKEPLNYFQEKYQDIKKNMTQEDLLSLIEALTHTKILNETLKEFLTQEIVERMEKGVYTDNQIFKIFTFLCRGEVLIEGSSHLTKFETKISEIDLTTIQKPILTKSLFNLKFIRFYSENVFANILNLLKENSQLLDEKNLIPILSYLNDVQYPENFLLFLNDYIMKTYLQRNYSISILSSFIFQLTKAGLMKKTTFRDLEKYILENFLLFKWTPVDLKILLNGCRMRGFADSVLYEKLEVKIHGVLMKRPINIEDFINLVYEISQGVYLPKFEVFKTILTQTHENFSMLFNCLENSLKLFRSIVLLVIRYRMSNENNYLKSHYNFIQKELARLFPKFIDIVSDLSLQNQNIALKVQFFQIIFTIHFEFPELIQKYYPDLQILKYFENQNLNLSPITSDLALEIVKILSSMKIKHSVEHKAYAYFVDIFIEPNLAIQIEGKAHYTEEAFTEVPKDAFRDYHLKKLGFKTIKIPVFEFDNLLSIEEQKTYLQDKIFGEELKFKI